QRRPEAGQHADGGAKRRAEKTPEQVGRRKSDDEAVGEITERVHPSAPEPADYRRDRRIRGVFDITGADVHPERLGKAEIGGEAENQAREEIAHRTPAAETVADKH